MIDQPLKKKRSPLLIIIGSIIGICCFCIATSFAMDALGLLPETTPIPSKTPAPTNTPIPTQTIPPTLTPAEKYFNEYGGDLGTYQNILDLTDCALLQEKFDIAAGNNERAEAGTAEAKWTLGYMTAANEHMQSIGCDLSAPTDTPTATPPPPPTATLIVILPTQPPSGGSTNYDNNGDGKVTCADFQTQAAAQQAYNAGYKNLDGNDNDGKACESLP